MCKVRQDGAKGRQDGGETASDCLHDLLKDYDRKGELEDVIPLGLREAFDVEDDLGCRVGVFAVSCRIGTEKRERKLVQATDAQ